MELRPYDDILLMTMVCGFDDVLNGSVTVDPALLKICRRALFTSPSTLFDKYIVISPLLRCTLILEMNIAKLFLSKSDMFFPLRLADTLKDTGMLDDDYNFLRTEAERTKKEVPRKYTWEKSACRLKMSSTVPHPVRSTFCWSRKRC